MKKEVDNLTKFRILREDLEACAKLAADIGFNSIASVLLIILAALAIKNPTTVLSMLKELAVHGLEVGEKYITLHD